MKVGVNFNGNIVGEAGFLGQDREVKE